MMMLSMTMIRENSSHPIQSTPNRLKVCSSGTKETGDRYGSIHKVHSHTFSELQGKLSFVCLLEQLRKKRFTSLGQSPSSYKIANQISDE